LRVVVVMGSVYLVSNKSYIRWEQSTWKPLTGSAPRIRFHGMQHGSRAVRPLRDFVIPSEAEGISHLTVRTRKP